MLVSSSSSALESAEFTPLPVTHHTPVLDQISYFIKLEKALKTENNPNLYPGRTSVVSRITRAKFNDSLGEEPPQFRVHYLGAVFRSLDAENAIGNLRFGIPGCTSIHI